MESESVAHILTEEQQNAVFRIESASGVYLLHGVTGSGKTEVYMRVIEDAVKNNKTAVMLVPEISLTPNVMRLFRNRFKGQRSRSCTAVCLRVRDLTSGIDSKREKQ